MKHALIYYAILICLTLYPFNVFAHHDILSGGVPAPLKDIESLPHINSHIDFNDHTLFITVVDRGQHTVDVFLYASDSYKRPLLDQRQVSIESDDGVIFNDTLAPDANGLMSLRYSYTRPFKCRLRVMSSSARGVETDIYIGSPGPDLIFILIIGLLVAVVFVMVKLILITKTQRTTPPTPFIKGE